MCWSTSRGVSGLTLRVVHFPHCWYPILGSICSDATALTSEARRATRANRQAGREASRSGAQGVSSGTRRVADFDVEVAAHGPGHGLGPGPKGGRASQPDGHDGPGSHHRLERRRAEQHNAANERQVIWDSHYRLEGRRAEEARRAELQERARVDHGDNILVREQRRPGEGARDRPHQQGHPERGHEADDQGQRVAGP
jgi:hypothetical protein